MSTNGPAPSYVPPSYQAMPAQPQAYAPQQPQQEQGQPMMYAAQPVAGPVNGGVYAQPVGGVYAQPVGEHVVVINGGAAQPPPQYVGFSDGVFDCFEDASSCLLSCCVTPIRWAMTIERARLMTFVSAVLIYGIVYWGFVVMNTIYNRIMCTNVNEVCADVPSWLPILLAILMLICAIVRVTLGTVYRGKIREQHNIPGSTLEDCCLHLCCTCCAVAQEARHVDRMTGHLPHTYRQIQ